MNRNYVRDDDSEEMPMYQPRIERRQRIALWIGVALLLIVGSMVTYKASAADVTLSWSFDSSTSAVCEDGSPAAANCPATGFEIQQLDPVTNIWSVREGVAATLRTKVLTNVPPGNRCYRMRTNSNGTFSNSPSSQACVTVPPPSAKAPHGITVTVVVTVVP